MREVKGAHGALPTKSGPSAKREKIPRNHKTQRFGFQRIFNGSPTEKLIPGFSTDEKPRTGFPTDHLESTPFPAKSKFCPEHQICSEHKFCSEHIFCSEQKIDFSTDLQRILNGSREDLNGTPVHHFPATFQEVEILLGA